MSTPLEHQNPLFRSFFEQRPSSVGKEQSSLPDLVDWKDETEQKVTGVSLNVFGDDPSFFSDSPLSLPPFSLIEGHYSEREEDLPFQKVVEVAQPVLAGDRPDSEVAAREAPFMTPPRARLTSLPTSPSTPQGQTGKPLDRHPSPVGIMGTPNKGHSLHRYMQGLSPTSGNPSRAMERLLKSLDRKKRHAFMDDVRTGSPRKDINRVRSGEIPVKKTPENLLEVPTSSGEPRFYAFHGSETKSTEKKDSAFPVRGKGVFGDLTGPQAKEVIEGYIEANKAHKKRTRSEAKLDIVEFVANHPHVKKQKV